MGIGLFSVLTSSRCTCFTKGVVLHDLQQSLSIPTILCFYDSELPQFPLNVLLSKLERYECDEWTVQWIRNWLDDCIQWVVVSRFMSRWKWFRSGVPQGSLLGAEQFNIFINDIKDETESTESTLSRFANYTKMNGADKTEET